MKSDSAILAENVRVDLSLQHLILELARIDLLLQREINRWRSAGQNPLDDFRGLYVSDEIAQSLLDLPFGSNWGGSIPLDPQALENDRQIMERTAAQAARLAEMAEPSGQELRLRRLCAMFDLDDFERDALLICLAPALDLRYERIFGYLQDDVTHRRPSVNLILNMLCDPGAARLTELPRFTDPAPLLRHNLLERVVEPGGLRATALSQSFQVDETIVAWLLGNYLPHPQIREYTKVWQSKPFGSDAQGRPEDTNLILAGETGRKLAEALSHDATCLEHALLSFTGPDQTAQEAAARWLASRMPRPLLELDLASVLLKEEADVLSILLLARRDARLTGAMLMVKGLDACLTDGAPPEWLLDTLGQEPDDVILASQTPWLPRTGDTPIRVRFFNFPLPRFAQRQVLWRHFLGDQAAPVIDSLAGRFVLTTRQIRDAAMTALSLVEPLDQPPGEADLLAAARAHSNPRLSNLAHKIEPRYTWQDIILPPDQMELLKEIITTVLHRAQVLDQWGVGEKLASSQGVTVLFAGPPGTGKTMAAEIIASALGLDLYKIDLSTIVSKYIGETEKNLERIFNEASSSNAILFFDEADALFGKRSEVRDSHDRYANIETSYLLQRMEAYDGVTILATNLRANLDEAFTRRLQFAVDFPFPTEEDRLRIWQALFPPGVPHEPNLDFRSLAGRFKLAGGNIRNILVSAAYLAAADGGQVTMNHLMHSTRREMQKMGRLVNSEDLSPS